MRNYSYKKLQKRKKVARAVIALGGYRRYGNFKSEDEREKHLYDLAVKKGGGACKCDCKHCVESKQKSVLNKVLEREFRMEANS